jgi:hypothetical protein
MFGGSALKVKGKVFACFYEGWGRRVAKAWTKVVRESLQGIAGEAERRARSNAGRTEARTGAAGVEERTARSSLE